jgi:hypothetical protein
MLHLYLLTQNYVHEQNKTIAGLPWMSSQKKYLLYIFMGQEKYVAYKPLLSVFWRDFCNHEGNRTHKQWAFLGAPSPLQQPDAGVLNWDAEVCAWVCVVCTHVFPCCYYHWDRGLLCCLGWPWSPELKWPSCLIFPRSSDYRCVLLHWTPIVQQYWWKHGRSKAVKRHSGCLPKNVLLQEESRWGQLVAGMGVSICWHLTDPSQDGMLTRKESGSS